MTNPTPTVPTTERLREIREDQVKWRDKYAHEAPESTTQHHNDVIAIIDAELTRREQQPSDALRLLDAVEGRLRWCIEACRIGGMVSMGSQLETAGAEFLALRAELSKPAEQQSPDLREFRGLAEKWRENRIVSHLGPLHGAGIAEGQEWCAAELIAAIERQEKRK